MLDSERAYKIKGKVMLDNFGNFAYVSSYLHLKSFAWEGDCPISSKLQNVTKLTGAILRSTYGVLQVTSK